MTPELKAQADKLESEYAELKSAYDKVRADWETGQAAVAPVLEKMRGLEALMDQAKPRLRELEEGLAHLRKAVK